jgi:signal transduction histidine kinase
MFGGLPVALPCGQGEEPAALIIVYFVYGLAFFSLGLAVALEARRQSALVLSRHLPWLAAFGLTHALVEWLDMFLLGDLPGQLPLWIESARVLLLPVSAVLLVRFGAGLIGEAGPLPQWLVYMPVALIVPAALLVAYALIVSLTEPPLSLAAEVWSRYLLYGPGCVVAAIGLLRQGRRLPQLGLGDAGWLLVSAAGAFGFNALVAGLLVPPAPHGLAPWINSDLAVALTGLPVQIWRAGSAVVVTVLVIRALGVFEAERQHLLEGLRAERGRAQQAALAAHAQARHTAEAWTSSLVDINRSVANISQADEVLPAILQAARRLLAADAAALALWDEAGAQLELRLVEAEGDPAASAPALDDGLLAEAARQGRPLRIPQDEAGPWVCPGLGRQVEAAGIVPLRLNGRSLGALWVSRAAGPGFSCADLVGLGHLADQAVIAIEHVLMAGRLQSLAVLEERGRIAREMHDGLSQVLGYLSLQTQTLEALVRRGDCPGALAELKQARAHIHEAQADVRENILSLRTTLSGQVGLLPALGQYVDEFEVQTGIQAELHSELGSSASLSPLAEAQVVRIAQEALTNVRKHASARRVRLSLAECNGHLRLTITDDGSGFDTEAVGRGHFGLQTMRERAESVGGGLCVQASPGQGTELRMWVPLAQN